MFYLVFICLALDSWISGLDFFPVSSHWRLYPFGNDSKMPGSEATDSIKKYVDSCHAVILVCGQQGQWGIEETELPRAGHSHYRCYVERVTETMRVILDHCFRLWAWICRTMGILQLSARDVQILKFRVHVRSQILRIRNNVHLGSTIHPHPYCLPPCESAVHLRPTLSIGLPSYCIMCLNKNTS